VIDGHKHTMAVGLNQLRHPVRHSPIHILTSKKVSWPKSIGQSAGN